MYKNEFLESNNIQNRDLNHNLNQASYSIHPNILKKNNTNRMETLKQTNSNNSQSNNEFSQKNPTDLPQSSQSGNNSENYTKSILESLCENEKAFRSLQMNVKIEKMKREVLVGQLDQKKKNSEILKNEVKKIKVSLEKIKDQILVVSRENDFLHDMIEYTAKDETL